MGPPGGPLTLVVNPAATRVRTGVLDAVVAALATEREVDVRPSRAPGDAARIAVDAARDGTGLVVALGGDGTVAEVAGALAGTACPMAPLPGGSTNVFARAMGWPRDTAGAAAALAGSLAAGTAPHTVHLGVVRAGGREHVCTSNAGLGIDAEAVAAVEAHPRAKRRLRQAAFAAGVLAATVRLARHPVRMWVSADGAPPEPLGALAVAWAHPYAYFGPRELDLVPGAASDGRLAWMGARSARPLDVAMGIAGALTGGWHVRRAGIAYGTGAREVRVHAERPVALQADGEPLGRHQDVVLASGPPLLLLAPAGRGTALKSG